MKRTGPVGIVTLVCLTCGREHFFEQALPSSLRCETCHGTVFRQFATPTEPDEATVAQLEEQTRSIAYDDPSPDTTLDDAQDLDLR